MPTLESDRANASLIRTAHNFQKERQRRVPDAIEQTGLEYIATAYTEGGVVGLAATAREYLTITGASLPLGSGTTWRNLLRKAAASKVEVDVAGLPNDKELFAKAVIRGIKTVLASSTQPAQDQQAETLDYLYIQLENLADPGVELDPRTNGHELYRRLDDISPDITRLMDEEALAVLVATNSEHELVFGS
jgi:hypothetical protein